ncbi:MAG: hypothetical protein SNJ75_19515, partial [Gemmataceae bacterium]
YWPLYAQELLPADEPGPGPLFNPEDYYVNPLHFALQAFGASALPSAGHGTLATLYAGEHELVRAWNFLSAMSGRESRISVGAASAMLDGFAANPYSTLATLKAGESAQCWILRDTDKFYRLPAEWLETVHDHRVIPVGDLEAETYAKILTLANYTSDRAFRAQARKDLTPMHLHTEPALHRGKVVFIEGHLRLINRYTPPPEALQEGVNDLYEAWIFPDAFGAKAICVVFTEWPAGLPRSLLGQRKTDRIRVQVAGYFFKLLAYETRDREQPEKSAPLLIAHTLSLPGAKVDPVTERTAWMVYLIYGVPCLLIGLIVTLVAVTIYFRRRDQQLRDHLRRLREREFVPPPADETPMAIPVSGPVRNAQIRRAPVTARYHLPGRCDSGVEGSTQEGTKGTGGKPPDEPTSA